MRIGVASETLRCLIAQREHDQARIPLAGTTHLVLMPLLVTLSVLKLAWVHGGDVAAASWRSVST